MKQTDSFAGFSKETLSFLKSLQMNNNKEWFEKHKEDYNLYLLNPLRSLVNDLSEFMLTIDPHFEVSPAINRTISRIYRDTRFTKDKSPYKTTAWITFKRPKKDWKDSPAYFFELSRDSYRFGMGLYSASPNTMSLFREAIDEKPEEFNEAIRFYRKQDIFHIEGEKYVRIIDKNKTTETLDWYQRKNLYLVCNRKIDNMLFSQNLVENLSTSFALLEPLYQYLLKVRENDANIA
jgi:uncharacterized protein (TIGR02453 family)